MRSGLPGATARAYRMKYLLAAVSAAIVVGIVAWEYQSNRYTAQILDIKLDHAGEVARMSTEYAASLKRAREQSDLLQQTKDEALNAQAQRIQVLQATARTANAQSDRLRTQLAEAARRMPNAPVETLAEYANTVSELFADCQRAYQDVAEKADGHASDVQLMSDAWPKTGD